MTRRYLEITAETKSRLGFYNDLPPNPIEFAVEEWYITEGEVIKGVEDLDTGAVVGPPVARVANDQKGEKDIEAIEGEIGARIIKVLLREGQTAMVDLRTEPLRLAELEVGEGVTQTPFGAASTSPEKRIEQSSETHLPKKERRIRVSPLAQLSADEFHLPIDDIIASLGDDILELTPEHVIQFAEAKGRREAPGELSVKTSQKTRRHAKDLGIELAQVTPTGPSSIVRFSDVEEYAQRVVSTEGVGSETIRPQQEGVGVFEVVTPSMRRKVTARHMTEAWRAPHASPRIDINAAPLRESRERLKGAFEELHGIKLRFDHYFIAACSWLLNQKEFKILNACWHDEDGKPEIRFYRHVNTGIAIAISPDKTKSGYSELVTPSVKRAEERTFVEIAKEVERLIADVVEGRPKTEDLIDTTFIVNNTGSPVKLKSGRVVPGDEFPDPIFAPGTSAILAFGAAREVGGAERMNIVLRFDHRICDGYEPKLFLRELQELLENPYKILLLR